MTFSVYKQPVGMDCDLICVSMAVKHHGRSISLSKIRSLSESTREGSSLKNLAVAAEKRDFRTISVKVNFEKLIEDAAFPSTVQWRQNRFVVVYAESALFRLDNDISICYPQNF